ncbi:hypothetical protein [Nubsella zeaxanthinifaciens]|uniref:hypothetical protein n=1 Tax=Nubsella zeaxanthinifaciens TaxID=392412 RepID=UPI000DE208EE|nr:hypothetical protein [Nubsella zeaxanthinifaciens]
MNKMADNMEWENEAPELAKLEKKNPFTVPAHYFDELSERTQSLIFIESLKREGNSGFEVPANYFKTLEEQINSRLTIEQLTATSESGFKVPDGYFNQLQSNIVAKTKSTKTVKLWHKPLFKYAVSACLVLASTTGWFANKQYQETKLRNTELAKEQLLYDIDESVILEYVQETQNTKTANVSDSEMENYILDNFSAHELSNSL